MNYCIFLDNPALRGLEQLDKCEEIKIIYRKEDTTLPEFLELHKHQKIILCIKEEDFVLDSTIKRLKAIKENHSEYNLSLCLCYTKPVLDVLESENFKNLNIPFFFKEYSLEIEGVYDLISLGVSEIYITNSLCFSIKTLKSICQEHNVKIRCYPNVAQSNWIKESGLTKFWIRPEDIKIYEPYIDTCELLGNRWTNTSAATYYTIYAEDKCWDGNLANLIIDLNINIDARTVLPVFAKTRLDCGKRCLYGKKCKVCSMVGDIANFLSDNNFKIESVH